MQNDKNTNDNNEPAKRQKAYKNNDICERHSTSEALYDRRKSDDNKRLERKTLSNTSTKAMTKTA